MGDWSDTSRMKIAGIPARFWQREIELPEVLWEYVAALDTTLRDYSNPQYGQGLVIGGPRASEWGCGILREALSRGFSCKFMDFVGLVELQKEQMSEYDPDQAHGLKQSIYEPEVLLLDRVVLNTEYQTDVLYRITKTRYDAGRATILTGQPSLSHALGDRFVFDQAAWLTK